MGSQIYTLHDTHALIVHIAPVTRKSTLAQHASNGRINMSHTRFHTQPQIYRQTDTPKSTEKEKIPS